MYDQVGLQKEATTQPLSSEDGGLTEEGGIQGSQNGLPVMGGDADSSEFFRVLSMF